MPRTSLQIEHLAMATRWRLVLRGGEKQEQQELGAVADQCTEIIDDWDRLLSRFNSASEVSRLNQAKAGTILKLHPDLFDLLQVCDHARQTTGGLFEVALPSENPLVELKKQKPYQLDLNLGTFAWLAPNHRLDFGGIAKGYVLDRLLQFVQKHHVTAALFDAGGSSLLAWDTDPNAAPWQVTLSPPGEGPRELLIGAEAATTAQQVRPWLELQNKAFAYSATRFPGAPSGQTIDPRSGDELAGQRACVVLTQTAAWAEVLSTAALCMGEADAAKYIKDRGLVAVRLGWIDDDKVRWYSSDD